MMPGAARYVPVDPVSVQMGMLGSFGGAAFDAEALVARILPGHKQSGRSLSHYAILPKGSRVLPLTLGTPVCSLAIGVILRIIRATATLYNVMAAPSKDIVFAILQFLKDEGLRDTSHVLERETGLYFDVEHFEGLILNGRWDESEKYLSGFTVIEDNGSSLKIYFEIRKQKYLEALDRRDISTALRILRTELRVFQSLNYEIFSELTSLLALDDFRHNEKLAGYGDTNNARLLMTQEVRGLIDTNPALLPKKIFPALRPATLGSIFTQGAAWSQVGPQTGTVNGLDLPNLLPGHLLNGVAGLLKGQHASAVPAPAASLAAPASFLPYDAAGALWPAPNLPAPFPANTAAGHSWRLPSQGSAGMHRNCKRTSAQAESDSAGAGPAPPAKRIRSQPEASSWAADLLPTQTVRVVKLPSAATTCDFHPQSHALLLAGTASGHVVLWALAQQECLAEVACTSKLLHTASVTRVTWAPDGDSFGVAFAAFQSLGIIHLYKWSTEETQIQGERLEINAHKGGVNDLALTRLEGQLVAVSGGSDACVMVWNASTGSLMFCFSGHEGPVYSVCPHVKGNISFVFSTGRDGRIKAWLYTNQAAAIVDYNAPGQWWTAMAYSTDGTRLFSCGVGSGASGESPLVEWNESDGTIAQRYRGFKNIHQNLVRFDTAANRFIVAGDEHLVKVWDMDAPGDMGVVAVECELPASPVVRVNRPASLLAVSTTQTTLAILATTAGCHLLSGLAGLTQPLQPLPHLKREGDGGPQVEAGEASTGRLEAVAQTPKPHQAGDAKPEATPARAPLKASEPWRAASPRPPLKGAPPIARAASVHGPPAEVASRQDCSAVLVASELASSPVRKVLFASGGALMLALCEDGLHQIWRWTEPGAAGVAGWRWVDSQWMSNGPAFTSGRRPTCCLAISNNSSYVLSASGGRVSLHNLISCKLVTTFQESAPAATALAFHPQDNNIIVLGLADGAVMIYNVQLDETQQVLQFHQGAVSSIAWLEGGNVLACGGSDARISIWERPAVAPLEPYHVKHKIRLHAATSTRQLPEEPVKVQAAEGRGALLAVHPWLLALYAAGSGARTAAWAPSSASPAHGPITAALMLPDCSQVCAAFQDSSLALFDATSLALTTHFLPQVVDPGDQGLFASAMACQQCEPVGIQVALGLHNGSLLLFQPPRAVSDAGCASTVSSSGEATSDVPPKEEGNGVAAKVHRPAK